MIRRPAGMKERGQAKMPPTIRPAPAMSCVTPPRATQRVLFARVRHFSNRGTTHFLRRRRRSSPDKRSMGDSSAVGTGA